MGPNLTFDTGALIALERWDRPMMAILAAAERDEKRIYMPQVVLVEWWRGESRRGRQILEAITVDPFTTRQARIAGEALAAMGERARGRGSTLSIDALVMASAAERGDIVLTSDPDDLLLLCEFFPAVRRIERV